MRSMWQRRAGGLAPLGALLVLGLLGCSEKVTAPNSRPVPEGQQNNQMLMMGWHEQFSVSFVLNDPGTPTNPSDDVLGSIGLAYWADTAGVRTTTLDFSQSNQLEALRVGSDGNVAPLFDFMLEPTVRMIGSDMEAFDFEDFSPASVPAYFGRGVLNGQITTASPVSNRASAFPSSAFNMDFLPAPKGPAGDSILDIQFADDPRASFYVVEVGDASPVLGSGDVYSNARRLYGIPSPLLPGTLPLNGFTFLLPGGYGLTGVSARISSRRWPLFFHLRITAFDAEGRMVNRVNDYLHTSSTSAGTNFNAYEPLGGAVEVLDPYPDSIHPISPPDVLTAEEAFQILIAHAGDPRQGVPSRLGPSGASGTPASSADPAFSDAVRQILASPMFSRQASAQRFQAIRDRLAKAPASH